MLCPECGREFAEDAVFCPHDGQGLIQVGEPSLIGTVIDGKYTVTDVLGEGGMGAVYLARHETMNREVAIKVLRREFSQNAEAIQRFLREARASSMLSHPNTITVYDCGQTETGQLYMVMQRLTGRSLAEIIDTEGAMPPERAVHILSQVCDSLTEAHSVGIIHRDLKPDNILIESKYGNPDWVTVLDFGIAKLLEGGGGAGRAVTQAGLICGTPDYISPEQVTGDPVDARSDIYALGVLLYELLTGQRPFVSESLVALMAMHVNDPPPPLDPKLEAKLPAKLVSLTFELMAKDPNDRPASCQLVRQRLQAALAPAEEPAPAHGVAGSAGRASGSAGATMDLGSFARARFGQERARRMSRRLPTHGGRVVPAGTPPPSGQAAVDDGHGSSPPSKAPRDRRAGRRESRPEVPVARSLALPFSVRVRGQAEGGRVELIQADAVGGLVRGAMPRLSPGERVVLESADGRLEDVTFRARMVRRATVTQKPMVVLEWEKVELRGDARAMGQALGRLLGLGKAAPLVAVRDLLVYRPPTSPGGGLLGRGSRRPTPPAERVGGGGRTTPPPSRGRRITGRVQIAERPFDAGRSRRITSGTRTASHAGDAARRRAPSHKGLKAASPPAAARARRPSGVHARAIPAGAAASQAKAPRYQTGGRLKERAQTPIGETRRAAERRKRAPLFERTPVASEYWCGEEPARAMTLRWVGMSHCGFVVEGAKGAPDVGDVVHVVIPMEPVTEGALEMDGVVSALRADAATDLVAVQVRLGKAAGDARYRQVVQYWSVKSRGLPRG